jgi:hypothetical protein
MKPHSCALGLSPEKRGFPEGPCDSNFGSARLVVGTDQSECDAEIAKLQKSIRP